MTLLHVATLSGNYRVKVRGLLSNSEMAALAAQCALAGTIPVLMRQKHTTYYVNAFTKSASIIAHCSANSEESRRLA